MNFIADLHIHSRFSMATSRQLNIPHLAGWAMCKGIHVLGTGDFTHPAWRDELRESLRFDEETGFYRMNGEPQEALDGLKIDAPRPLFCLQCEISSIYKRGGRVRKVHNLVFMPTLEAADAFSKKLGAIGNVTSDGRPILGLDSKDLLEIALETSDQAAFIPAHIWTPWFSLFGSKSGFNAIEDCFGDLTGHIFALETGLSSDPFMNRHVSALDGYALVSNSDAHSGANLGRESNVFSGPVSYAGMFGAIKRRAERRPAAQGDCVFEGTLEIYPEEGKYHLDGHRNCGVVLSPEESARQNDICPVCGKPLTIGVLHRVWELADRAAPPELEEEQKVYPILPLPAILAQILGQKQSCKAVGNAYRQAIAALGPEFGILHALPVAQIADFSKPLAEAVLRVRERRLRLQGGYDGEFGTVEIFTEAERKELTGWPFAAQKRKSLLQAACLDSAGAPHKEAGVQNAMHLPSFWEQKPNKEEREAPAATTELSQDQDSAMRHKGAPLLVLAGPGSGKTRLLVERLAFLLQEKIPAREILALTFSRKAAEEMRERLLNKLGEKELPLCATFHSLAWQEVARAFPQSSLLQESEANAMLRRCLLESGVAESDSKELVQEVSRARELALDVPEEAKEGFSLYGQRKSERGLLDFADLLEAFIRLLEEGRALPLPKELLVDEIQDLSPLQLRMLSRLLPADGSGFFGIGDPDQSIYGFRGSASNIEARLRSLFPSLEVRALKTSYRSSQGILDAAAKAMQGRPASGALSAARELKAELHFFEAPSAAAECIWVAEKVKRLIGSGSSTQLGLLSPSGLEAQCAPSEIAVLVRLKALIPPLLKALEDKGVPVQAPSERLFWQDESAAAVLSLVEASTRQEGVLPGSLLQSAPPEPWQLVQPLLERGIASKAFFEGAAWEQLCRAYKDAGSWTSLLDRIRFMQEEDLLKSKSKSVRLLTLHASKGLEFKAVFMPCLEDGILPFSRERVFKGQAEASISPEELEEERRLLYVGLTRASQALYLSRASTRSIYGHELSLPPSPFLKDFLDAFERTRLAARRKERLVQGSLL